MRRQTIKAWLALALGLSGPLQAAELTVRMARVATPSVELRDIAIGMHWPERHSPQRLDITVGSLRMDEPALALQDLTWRCAIEFAAGSAPACNGDLAFSTASGERVEAQFGVRWGAQALAAVFGRGDATLAVELPWRDDAPIAVTVRNVPAVWLQDELAAFWADASFTGGLLGGAFEISWNADDALELRGDIRAEALGLDTLDGSIATAGLEFAGRLEIAVGRRFAVDADLLLHAGELLVDRFYVALPARPLRFFVAVREQEAERWRFDNLRFEDPDVVEASGTLTLDAARDWQPIAAETELAIGDAGEVASRYLDGLLGLAGLQGLQAQGGIEAALRWDTTGLRFLRVVPRSLSLADGAGRFSFDALSGRIEVGAEAPSGEGSLRWDGASFYRIALGALDLTVRSGNDRITLARPSRIETLGGEISIDRFHWARSADGDPDFGASLALHGLDLARLTEAFGWPAFGGQLSGTIPAVRYEDGILAFDGGLDIGVFDGSVEIESLSMERPFGVLPTLNADIRFAGLDLGQMTRVFDFGEIQGRLRGHILGLRLIDWTPVAFDAQLRTEQGAGPRRISQRAVESLSSVGGGGAVAALQSGVLRMFSTFSYDEIGMSCRLRNDVCQMDGIDSAGQGYAIVKGSGLPRISVVGHQRKVDWPVLLGRLKSATAGAGAETVVH